MIKPKNLVTHLLLIIISALILRLTLLWPLGLNDDEAYYWMWAHMPSLSYFDNTPGAGWFLWPAINLFGDHVLVLRIYTALSGVLTGFVITRTVYELNPGLTERERLVVLWLATFSGVGLLTSLAWTPDTPLMLFISLGTWQFIRALNTGKSSPWLWCGIFFSLALLSKATAGITIALAGFWMVISPHGRKQLAQPWPWIAFIFICLSLLPILIWNLNNDWAFFKFQTGHVFDPEPGSSISSTDQKFPYWQGLVLLLLTYPLLGGAALISAIKPGQLENSAMAAIRWIALVSTVLYSLIALYKEFPPHWALINILLLFTLGLSKISQYKRRWYMFQFLSPLLVVIIVSAITFWGPAVAAAKNWQNGLIWDQIYENLREVQGRFPDSYLLASLRYQDASQLAHKERWRWNELPGGHAVPALNLVGRSNHYAHVWHSDTYRGASFILLAKSRKPALKKYFCELTPLDNIQISYRGVPIRTLYIYKATGFSGRPDVAEDRAASVDCRNQSQ